MDLDLASVTMLGMNPALFLSALVGATIALGIAIWPFVALTLVGGCLWEVGRWALGKTGGAHSHRVTQAIQIDPEHWEGPRPWLSGE